MGNSHNCDAHRTQILTVTDTHVLFCVQINSTQMKSQWGEEWHEGDMEVKSDMKALHAIKLV